MKKLNYILLSFLCLSACTGKMDVDNYNGDIVIDGITTDELVVTDVETKADQNAEEISWLLDPLYSGLDITYYKNTSDSRVAVLKLTRNGSTWATSESGKAIYSFKYRDNNTGDITTTNAKWNGNGEHTFEGVYVPDAIKKDIASKSSITTDQSDANYTYLSRYLGMPANYKVSATVGSVKLPFKHRLARVIAFVLIDPSMTNVEVKSISFENVKVLDYVKDEYNASKQHHTYTPQWTTARKVDPHSLGKLGSIGSDGVALAEDFIVYYTDIKDTDTYIYPTSTEEWKAAKAAYDGSSTHGGYSMLDYGKSSCYDIIARPTYTSVDNVMYDEDLTGTTAAALAAETNKINFAVTLSNGLTYEKAFAFDLDANYETVVYLRINKEKVDYSSSGSAKWISTSSNLDFFGIDNYNAEINHTLSDAGSSWQRAYRIGTTDPTHSDGNTYKDYQNISDTEFINKLVTAVEGGACNGYYFVLTQNISIPLSKLPNDFVFTGHLDGREYTITLTDAGDRNYLFDGLNGTLESSTVHSGVPVVGYRGEIINTNVSGVKLFKTDAVNSGHVENCYDKNGKVTDVIPDMKY